MVVFDAASREQIATVEVSAVGAQKPASLFFAPDGAFLDMGAEIGGTVVEIDNADWTITRTFGAGDGADGLEISSVVVAPAG
ncbi:MAG: hypothetical protein AAFX81_16865 [Pseudomonadota bacterium]